MNIYAPRSECGNERGSVWLMLCECLIAGIITAGVYACSLDGSFSPKTLKLPAVFSIAATGGAIMGFVFWPLILLSMRHLRFVVRGGAYLAIMISTAVFGLWLHSGFTAALATALGVCVASAFTKKAAHGEAVGR
jgi:hypothetical protein